MNNLTNFGHRIKEDSTEFEKAFLKIYDGNLWTALEKMKDWQPPKELIKVPKFVADWFESNKYDLEYRIWKYIRDWQKHDRDEFWKWFNKGDIKLIELLIRMKLEGYTVKKEQKYKVVFMDKLEYTIFDNGEDGTSSSGTPLTEKEIKDIDERYWTFAVKVDE